MSKLPQNTTHSRTLLGSKPEENNRQKNYTTSSSTSTHDWDRISVTEHITHLQIFPHKN